MYYLHIITRCDNDANYPMQWTEYRLFQSKQIPEHNESIYVEEYPYLNDMMQYCRDNNILEYTIIDHR